MGSVKHEHLLPLVGVCVAKSGLKIVTILRPLGSLLKFLGEHRQHLGAKQMIRYCYQISSVSLTSLSIHILVALGYGILGPQ